MSLFNELNIKHKFFYCGQGIFSIILSPDSKAIYLWYKNWGVGGWKGAVKKLILKYLSLYVLVIF